MMKILEYLKKPLVAAVLAGVIGLIVGLIWAWGVQPVVWKNVPPVQLGATYQEQYLRMAIDSYQVKPDDALAVQRYKDLGSAGPAILETIKNNPGTQDPNTILKFSDLVQGPGTTLPTPAPAAGATTPAKSGSLTFVIIFGAVVAFALVGFVIFRYLIPLLRNTGSSSPTAATRARDITSQTALTDYAAKGEEPQSPNS